MARTKKTASPPLVENRLTQFNARQIHAAQRIAAGASIASALREAGYATSTARHQPPHTIAPIRELALAEMNRQGLTLPAVIERLRSRIYSLTVKNVKTENGDDVTIELEDSGAQLKAIEIYGNWTGLNAPTKVEHSGEVKLSVEEKRSEQNRLFNRLGALS